MPPLPGPPPQAGDYARATVPGLPEVRGWGDDLSPEGIAKARAAVARRLQARWEEAGRPAEGILLQSLALSGGGPDGAFAAGLLAGWSETGERPQFELVTGVSVGALIAPFAFLGSPRDEALREIMTATTTEDVIEFRPLSALFGALGIGDPQPLRRRLHAFVDEGMLAEIAAEHAAGRRLLVGTTNLDAARPVIWDMGAIAAAGRRELFIDVMLASASIPGAFPPVPIEVEAGGRRHIELHVDGGVTRSVMIGPTGIAEAMAVELPFPVRRRIHVIQNNSLAPAYAPVGRSLPEIALRSVSTLIRGQSSGDLVQIWLAAEAAGADFRLAFVPAGFSPASAASFDPIYMSALYQAAFEAARDGPEWLGAPPGVLGYGALAPVAAAGPVQSPVQWYQ